MAIWGGSQGKSFVRGMPGQEQINLRTGTDNIIHSREKLKNVIVRKPGRKSYYFSPILS